MAIPTTIDFKNFSEVVNPRENIHAQDLLGIIGASRGFGNISGCGITLATNTITIATGTVFINNLSVSFTSDNEVIDDTGISSGQYKWVIIYITPAGALGQTSGTGGIIGTTIIKPTDKTNLVVCSVLKTFGTILTEVDVIPSTVDLSDYVSLSQSNVFTGSNTFSKLVDFDNNSNFNKNMNVNDDSRITTPALDIIEEYIQLHALDNATGISSGLTSSPGIKTDFFIEGEGSYGGDHPNSSTGNFLVLQYSSLSYDWSSYALADLRFSFWIYIEDPTDIGANLNFYIGNNSSTYWVLLDVTPSDVGWNYVLTDTLDNFTSSQGTPLISNTITYFAVYLQGSNSSVLNAIRIDDVRVLFNNNGVSISNTVSTLKSLTIIDSIAVGGNVDGVDISEHHANNITNVKHLTDAQVTALHAIYTHPSVNHIPSAGVTGQFLGWASTGAAAWVANPNSWRDIDDIPVDGITDQSISSNWAYDHQGTQNHAGLEDFLGIGATNLQFYNMVFRGTYQWDTARIDKTIFNEGATNFSGFWELLAPTTLGTLQFYATRVQILISDGDTSNKVSAVYLWGVSSSGASANLNDASNWNTATFVTTTYDHTNVNIGATYNYLVVQAATDNSTFGDLDIVGVRVEGYYG